MKCYVRDVSDSVFLVKFDLLLESMNCIKEEQTI